MRGKAVVTVLIALYLLAGVGTLALFCYVNRRESCIDILLIASVFCFWFLVLLVMLAESLEDAPTVRNPFWHRGTP